jgi:hypothetical protein
VVFQIKVYLIQVICQEGIESKLQKVADNSRLCTNAAASKTVMYKYICNIRYVYSDSEWYKNNDMILASFKRNGY